jgi:hypothetical protein
MKRTLLCLLAAAWIHFLFPPMAVAGAVVGSCHGVTGNLVVNCGFETGDLTGWTLIPAASGSLANVVHSVPHSGSWAFGFAGSTVGSYDTLQQAIATKPGVQYNLSFWLANNSLSGSDFQVLWNGVVVYDNSSPAFLYTKFSLTVVGTGSDTLSFRGYNLPGVYALDDIVLTQNTASYLSSSWWWWYVL